MSSSIKPRIVRKNFPKNRITRTGFRKVWAYLALDFEHRCAYSMQHTYRAGGRKCMEVDHFDPRKKRDAVQDYNNLFPATRHCNGAKRNSWPNAKDQRRGIRFLNCCDETDYGVHIFEDPDTHELVGITPEGRYHVRCCDLNAKHLIEERSERHKLWELLRTQPVKIKSGWSLPLPAQAMKQVVERMIPIIPWLSGKDLAQRRVLRKAMAALPLL